MSEQPPMHGDPRERLSALLDGECGTGGAEEACRAWRDDAGIRAAWHAYHMIGDVLRSDDLAQPAAHDEAFLVSLRARMADEPVVVAPTRAAPAAQPVVTRKRSWMAPLAAAAGFAAVAGVLVISRMGAPGADDLAPTLAAVPAGPGGLRPAAASAAVPEEAVVTDGALIRNARLDRYLAAHKQFAGNSAVAVPGMVLRSSATIAPAR